MLQPKPQPSDPSPRLPPRPPAAPGRAPGRPFGASIDAVLVDDRGEFVFEGAVRFSEANAVWTWLSRDVAPEVVEPLAAEDDPRRSKAVEAVSNELLARARAVLSSVQGSLEAERRLMVQLGGPDVRQRLPVVLNALKCAPLFDKARAFGRAVNGLPEDELVTALQAMPRQDAAIAALLMMAAMGQVIMPSRLIVAATRISGEATEDSLRRAGFSPLLDAVLAHAQNAIPPLLQTGAFMDMDLVCRAVERYHRLIRAISGYIELNRPSRIGTTIAGLTKLVSDKLEPRLRDIPLHVNQALRRARDAADRLDSDGLLAALNGLYLLAAVRDSRDSLALNEVFEESWSRTGQTLEMHLTRNLEALRSSPTDAVLSARVDAGIKMADVRFGTEYADVIRRARDGMERRFTSG